MAQFKPGESGNPSTQFSGEVAVEMQKRSAAARRENRTLREVMREALEEEAAPGVTRLEALARKTLANHYNGKLTFKDLRNLSAILGEDTLNIKTDGGVSLQVVVGSQEAAEGLKKAIETGAQPAKPKTDTED